MRPAEITAGYSSRPKTYLTVLWCVGTIVAGLAERRVGGQAPGGARHREPTERRVAGGTLPGRVVLCRRRRRLGGGTPRYCARYGTERARRAARELQYRTADRVLPRRLLPHERR